MAKEFDDISKKVDQSHKDLVKNHQEISKDLDSLQKNQDKIVKDIADIKKQIRDISFKIDMILEILNNFTIMLAEEEDDHEDYGSDEGWISDDEDELDYEDNDWNLRQDES